MPSGEAAFLYGNPELIRISGMQGPGIPDGERTIMNDFEKIWSFENLYKAHCSARKGKRGEKEVIEFEMNLGRNLTKLSDEIRSGKYKLRGYYTFMIHDPKERIIHALYYPDRVVQHCICDEVLMPLIDQKLIYDNAACRKNKGTHFALDRLSGFLHRFYKEHKDEGYFLKCDIRKFFDSIDHEVLKEKLVRIVKNRDVLRILFDIIDSYETHPGKGLPLGNQTSQWFAIYYMDRFDRYIKSNLKIRYYTRYMDDCVLIHEDREYLSQCRILLSDYLNRELKLEFNTKTQIVPIRGGVKYLGFHFYLTERGKVIRKVKQATKYKYRRRIKSMAKAYRKGMLSMSEINQVLNSYNAHLEHGNTYHLRKKIMSEAVFYRAENQY